ncbi:hypothetical protein ACS0TY_030008 [Phlomoides rotata]
MVPITAAELNYIIFRYFMESGFTHAAFMFDCEASIRKSPVKGNLIPHAALFTLVYKGLQYIETEEYLKKGEYDVDKEFCFLQAMDLIKKESINKKKNQHPTIAAKLGKEGKARKAQEREEADRKAREKERAYREAREKEKAYREARQKEEADRVARERDELDRAERRLSRVRIKRKKVIRWND